MYIFAKKKNTFSIFKTESTFLAKYVRMYYGTDLLFQIFYIFYKQFGGGCSRESFPTFVRWDMQSSHTKGKDALNLNLNYATI